MNSEVDNSRMYRETTCNSVYYSLTRVQNTFLNSLNAKCIYASGRNFFARQASLTEMISAAKTLSNIAMYD